MTNDNVLRKILYSTVVGSVAARAGGTILGTLGTILTTSAGGASSSSQLRPLSRESVQRSRSEALFRGCWMIRKRMPFVRACGRDNVAEFINASVNMLVKSCSICYDRDGAGCEWKVSGMRRKGAEYR